MPYLTLNGWDVPCAVTSGSLERDVARSDTSNDANRQVFDAASLVTSLSDETIPLVREEAEGLEGMLSGWGWRIPLDGDGWSTNGRPPTVFDAVQVSPGRTAASAWAVNQATWDLSRGVRPLLDRWTVMVWRVDDSSGAWQHWIVRSDGEVFRDGFRLTSQAAAPWLVVFNGFLTLRRSQDDANDVAFNELVVLPFVLSDGQCEAAAYRFQSEDRTWPSLPAVSVYGAAFGGRRVLARGEVLSSKGAEFNGPPRANGTGWDASARRVSFRLTRGRVEPQAAVPRPSFWLTFDAPTLVSSVPSDMVLPRGYTARTATSAVAEGQRAGALAFNGSTSSVAIGDPEEEFAANIPFGFSAAFMLDAAFPASSWRTIWGKFSDGIGAKLDCYYDPDAGTLRLRLTLAGDTGNYFLFQGERPVRRGDWHHVVATFVGGYEPKDRQMQVYLDGEQIASGAVTADIGDASNGEQEFLGRDADGNYFRGLLDEVGTWRIHLDEAAVAELYEAARQRRRPALSSSGGGRSLSLRRSAGYVVEGPASLLPNGSSWSCAFFMKVSSPPANVFAVGLDKSEPTNGNFSFALRGDTSPGVLQLYSTSGGSGITHTGPAAVTYGSWNSFVIRCGAVGYKVWVNGVLAHEFEHTGPAPGGSGALDSRPLVLGGAPVFGNFRADMLLAAYTIWQGSSFDAALAAAFDRHVRAGRSPMDFEVRPTTAWSFQDIVEGRVLDDTGHGVHLTATDAEISDDYPS